MYEGSSGKLRLLQMTFGERFGELVKRRRAIDDLTQEELAHLAFGDITKKTRISELENGKVKNPRASTVDAICVALGITGDYVERFITEPDRKPELESIVDFFFLDGYLSMDFEIAVNDAGMGAIFHDRKLKVEIERAEYISDLGILILVDRHGRRRKAFDITEKMKEKFENCNGLILVHCQTKGDYVNYRELAEGDIISELEVPLKVLN